MSFLKIILIIIFICVILLIGVIYFKNTNKENELVKQGRKDINENVITVNSLEKKINLNTKITFVEKFEKCGHLYEEKIETDKLINMTEEELRKVYVDCKIKEFDNSEVIIVKENDGICEEHYILKSNGEYIGIYNLNSKGEEVLSETTGIFIRYLAQADLIELEQGREIYGKEALVSALEDYE